jgi:hypothetical protein
MIGIWSAYSNIFLYMVGVAMLAVYGLPLTFMPLRWARVFGWETQPAGHLTVMLGRSLGILISLVAVFAMLVPVMPTAGPFFFDFMLCLIGLMTILHIYNALRRQQPKLETFEIALWVVLFVLTLCFYPV